MPSSVTREDNAQSDLDQEVLITVQTVHIPLEDTQSETESIPITNATDNAAATAAASSKFCFVCNAPKNESFVKMMSSVTIHSKKTIFDFIRKFMGSEPSVRNTTADATSLNDEMICNDCFKLVCNYDEARSNAKRIKKQIRQRLSITETYFEESQNLMDTTQTEDECGDGEQQQRSDVMYTEYDACDVIDLCDDD